MNAIRTPSGSHAPVHAASPALAPVAAIGRVLIAAMFVMSGFSKAFGIAGTAGYIASKGLPLPEVLAVAAAALEIVAGIALAVGWHARAAAAALALFTVVASLIFHPFWSVAEDQARMQQLMFVKNFAVIGALLFVAAVGAGPASFDALRASR